MNLSHSVAGLSLELILCFGLPTQYLRADTYYVDVTRPNDAGDGRSWGTAKQTIQAAIDIAVANDVVLVTNGIYAIGGRLAGAMTNRVAITNAVIVRAGSTNPAQTIISGAPDPGTGSNGPSAIRCVYVGTNAQLTGFTLANGYTKTYEQWETGRGGGAYGMSNSFIRNCVLTSNSAYRGGGFYGSAYSMISNCSIMFNTASAGGGIYVESKGVVSECDIIGNISSGGGGVCGNADSTIRNCNVISNQGLVGAINYGGGVNGGNYYNCRIMSNGRALLAPGKIEGGGGGYGGSYYNCQIISNTANYAGGLRSPIIAQDCEMRANVGGNGGGGFGDGSIYSRCRIIGNSCGQGAGGVCGEYLTTPPTTLVINCLILSNSAAWIGGVMRVVAVNSTIYGNVTSGGAARSGGIGSYGANYARSTVTNCIVYGNYATAAPGTPNNFEPGTYTNINYVCTTTNNGVIFTDAVGIVTNDPRFVDSTNGDFRLVRASPCINAGINQDWMANALDLEGNNRICNGIVDIGAYEYSRPRGTIITILGATAP